jgi:hypothetical protein
LAELHFVEELHFGHMASQMAVASHSGEPEKEMMVEKLKKTKIN